MFHFSDVPHYDSFKFILISIVINTLYIAQGKTIMLSGSLQLY